MTKEASPARQAHLTHLALDLKLCALQGIHQCITARNALDALGDQALPPDAPSSLTTGVRLAAFLRAAVKR
jgi:hypothetical protein